MDYALQNRNSTGALLPDGEYAGPPNADHSANRNDHGKHTRWIILVPKVSIRHHIYALLGTLALVALIAGTIGSVVGVTKYRRLAFPHRAVHASPAYLKDGGDVAQPYFPRVEEGQSSEARMAIAIWFREGTKPPNSKPDEGRRFHDDTYYWRQKMPEEDKRWSFGGQGYVVPDQSPQLHRWEAVWTHSMTHPDSFGAVKRMSTNVTLPGRVVHSLVMNRESALVATFALVPLNSDPLGPTLNFTSSRPISFYGEDQAWPLPFAAGLPTGHQELDDFLAHSAAGHQMRAQVRDWRAEHELYRQNRSDTDDLEREVLITFLSTKTAVFSAHDYSVYEMESFEKAMTALRGFKTRCREKPTYWSKECHRAFSRDGHFENMLEVEEAGKIQWRYGPYINALPGPSPFTDFIRLPNQTEMRGRDPSEVADLVFPWHVTYQSVSPARLSFIEKPFYPDKWGFLANSGEYAQMHDSREFYNAFLGMSSDPQSRPIARGVIGFISSVLGYVSIPLILHYWATRKTSTGIAILTQALAAVVYLVCYIVTTAVDMDGNSVLVFVLAILTFLAIIGKQLHLRFRPEFRTETYPLPSTSAVRMPVPTAVRFRYQSVAEAASEKQDARFPWWQRIVVVVVTFAILRFAPAPPPLIAAKKYRDVMHGFGGAMHWSSTVLEVIFTFKAIQSSVWFGCQISQILLNHRRKTFAGSYAFTAQLLYASQLLSNVTQVFVNWFGRPQLMQPFTTWDVITLMVKGTSALQGLLLPKVDQVIIDPVS